MAANVIKAMEAFATINNFSIKDYSDLYKIGINSAGSRFEYFIKDALVGTFFSNNAERENEYQKNYSWLGNQNHPPDAIAMGGDAFEIKKQENPSGTIALNSSPPNDMLYKSDTRLTKECKEIEGGKWDKRDLFYVVGWVKNGAIKSIYFVQGKCYAASKEIYEKIDHELSAVVKAAIRNSGLAYSSTNELGRVNKADPLGRASLRVRGMWQIQSPHVCFNMIAPLKKSYEFQAYAIMEKGKYMSLNGPSSNVAKKDVRIPDPNNPANYIDAVVMEVVQE